MNASMIKNVNEIMRKDSGDSDAMSKLKGLVWLLFLKVFDYLEEEWELVKEDYEPIVPIGYRWRDWASCENIKNKMTGPELINFVNNKLLKVLSGQSIKNENGEDVYPFTSQTKQASKIKEFMGDVINTVKDGVNLRTLIDLIDEIDFSDENQRHQFNDIYEGMLKELQKEKRNGGEFYTNRALTSFIIEKLDPKIGEKIADFACGTGGFLVDAMNYMYAQNPTLEQLEALQNSFYGVEKKPLPYMLCTTNMLLHGIENPGIYMDNILEIDCRSYTEEDKFDVIPMNPPYGGSEDERILINFPTDFRTTETESLFLYKIMIRLKKYGRAGVILPDGILFSNNKADINIKRKLLTEFNLHTIIRLPNSCFAPYTSIATNILFFTNEEPTGYVWFYRYDLINGQKFSNTKNPLTREKLYAIDEWWNNRVEIKDEKIDESMTETWKSRCVNIEEIINNGFNLDLCGYPIKEKIILSPEETIRNFQKERDRLDREMDNKLNEILSLLGIAKED